MYSAYKLNKQGNNMQPWRTPFPIWKKSMVPCPVLTFASWLTHRFLIQISDTDLATYSTHLFVQGFPGGASGKKKTTTTLPVNKGDIRDVSSIRRTGRSPGGGNGIPLQCSCLENPMDGGTCQATVHELQRVRHDWAHTYIEHMLCAKATFWSLQQRAWPCPSLHGASIWVQGRK